MFMKISRNNLQQKGEPRVSVGDVHALILLLCLLLLSSNMLCLN
jgi:hypothetical protein